MTFILVNGETSKRQEKQLFADWQPVILKTKVETRNGLSAKYNYSFSELSCVTMEVRIFSCGRGCHSVNMLIEARPSKARLHLNLAHAQQEKSRRLAEVPSAFVGFVN